MNPSISFGNGMRQNRLVVMIRQSRLVLTTTLAEGVKPSSNSGGTIAFEVEDLEALVTRLKSEDVKFKLDIFPSPVCRMAVILDSEGNAITLHQLHKKN